MSDDEYEDAEVLEEEEIDNDVEEEEDEDENEALEDEDEEEEEIPKTIKVSTKVLDYNHVKVRIVPSEERVTSNALNKHEITEAIGIRITQIDNGSKKFVSSKGLYTSREIAWREIAERKSPLILSRKVREYVENGVKVEEVERWKVREMALPEQAKYSVPANIELAEDLFIPTGVAKPIIKIEKTEKLGKKPEQSDGVTEKLGKKPTAKPKPKSAKK